MGRPLPDRTTPANDEEEGSVMSNVKLFGKFLGFVLELAFIGLLIWGAVAVAWWVAG